MSNIRRFWEDIAGEIGARAQPRQARYPARVVAVESDQTTGVPTSVRAALVDGGVEVSVPLPPGTGVRAGVMVELTQDAGNPTGAFGWGGIVYSDDPSTGFSELATLPPPLWSNPDSASALRPSPGATRADLTVYWVAVEAKYRPTGYVVSYRPVGGDWGESGLTPHLGGIQQANLGALFAPGQYVDVRIRAFYAWALNEDGTSGAYSLPGELRTIQVAQDTGSPGAATGLTVDTSVAGQLHLRALGTTTDYFAAWRYLIATAADGTGLQARETPGELVAPLATGNYYVAVEPVNRAGVAGGRYPATGYLGPHAVTQPAFYPDTQPPPAWTAAPTLQDTSYIDPQNVWRGRVKITLPGGYPFPSDYAYTLLRVENSTTGYVTFQRVEGTSLGPTEVEVGGGVITVDAVGYDTTRNRQTAWGPQATITLTAPGIPTGTLAVTTSTVGVGILVKWSGITGALWYEVWRSTASAGTSPVLVAPRVESGLYFDPLISETVIAPTYYYQVRSFNQGGAGPVSAGWTAGTAGKIDAQNLRVNSITAALVAADTGIFNKIVAGAILSDFFRTDVLPNTRVEIRGNAALEPNQIRLVENVAGVERVRARLQGSGLTVYGDGAQSDIAMYRNASGRGELKAGTAYFDSNGMRIYEPTLANLRASFLSDGMRLYKGANILTAYFLDTGSFFKIFDAPMKLVTQSGNQFIVQEMGYAGLLAAAVGFDVPNVQDTAFGVKRGNAYIWICGTGNGGHGIEWGIGTSADTVLYRSAANTLTTGNFVATGTLYSGPSTGQWRTTHTGAGGNAHQDNSVGGMYYGWFANPTAKHWFANGAQGGGVIWCNEIQRNVESVPSDPRMKDSVGTLGVSARDLIRQYPVQQFAYKHEARAAKRENRRTPRRLGVMADDVERALGPDAITDMGIPVGPDGTGQHPDWVAPDGKAFKGVDMQRVNMVTLAATQELAEEAERIAARLEDALRRIAELESSIAKRSER